MTVPRTDHEGLRCVGEDYRQPGARAAPAAAVWARAVTPEGFNHEMRPWVTMTMPLGARRSAPGT